MRAWVASGADINVVDGDGNTPLLRAAFPHRAESVAVILELGGDARHVNVWGRTALHQLAQQSDGGAAEVVRLLVAAGCDVGARDGHGLTAVEFARKCGDTRFEGLVAAATA